MSESMFFGIAVFVFALMVLGMVLTIIEFRNGEPHQQHKRKTRRKREKSADGG